MSTRDPSLQFSHLGDLLLEDELLIADASLVAASFEDVAVSHAGKPFPAQYRVPIQPGQWHVFTAGPEGARPEILFLSHHDELDEPHEAPEAAVFTRVVVPTRRIVVANPAVHQDDDTCRALGTVDGAQLPGMILHLGVMADLASGPVLAISSTTAPPHLSLFVPLAGP